MNETAHNTRKISPLADLLCTVLVLCRGEIDGQPGWAYVAIKPTAASAFREACEQGGVDLDEYGTILEAGTGEEPSQEIKDKMRERFGMRDDYEQILTEAINEQKIISRV